MTKNYLLCALIILYSANILHSQIHIPFDSLHWDVRSGDYQFREYKGQEALMMNGGIAILREGNFKNGIMEWDMAFPEQRGFTGVRFRMVDGRNFEEFYFRPHQSGQPDANQYCPVDNGISTWQLYHGEFYSVPYEYNFDKWFHVKLVISGTRAEVYIDNMRFPVLHIPFLKREPAEGGIMVYSALVPVHFANFSFTSMDDPELLHDPVEEDSLDPNFIDVWALSNPFPDTLLQSIQYLEEFSLKEFIWNNLPSENSGIANLGTVSDFHPQERNTVFARIQVESSVEQVKELQFGYSDRILVFCNGKLLYSGDNSYRTRDFRYLGTIGLFDAVHLPLKNGSNEIWMAVTESFGGWGVMGKFGNLEGLKIIN